MGGFGGGGGDEYEAEIEVGNPNPMPFSFDSIEMAFTDGVGRAFGKSPFSSLSGETIKMTKGGDVTIFHYDGKRTPPMKSDDLDDTPSDVVLKSHQAVAIRSSMASSLMPTICGRSFTVVNAQLVSGGKTVSETYRAVLPPIEKIPDGFNTPKGKGFVLRLWPEANIPAPSGIFDQSTLDKAFRKAAEASSGAVLAEISPEIMTVNSYGDDSTMHLPGRWCYRFWSPGHAFSIPQVDSSAVKADTRDKPSVALDKESLKECAVDFDAVTMMLELVGAKPDSEGFRCKLSATAVAGKPRPVWDVGYKLNGKKAYVFADTGQIVYFQNGIFEPFDVIWN